MRTLLFLLALCVCAEAKPKHKHHNMALADNLVGYWKMEQNPELFSIHDQSGNGNHLTGHGNPILVPGKVGQALQFDGVTQWLDMASNAGINHNGGEMTGMVWFKPLSLAHGKLLIGSVDWGVTIVQNGANFYVHVGIEDGGFDITDVPLVVGEWYCLFFGWYESNGEFSWGSMNLSDRVREFRTPWGDPVGAFKIAGNSAGGRLNAVIDDVAIWRRNVPARELYQLYNKGKGLPFEEWDEAADCGKIDCCD